MLSSKEGARLWCRNVLSPVRNEIKSFWSLKFALAILIGICFLHGNDLSETFSMWVAISMPTVAAVPFLELELVSARRAGELDQPAVHFGKSSCRERGQR